MVKFLYIVSLGIASFLLFIFSTEKEDITCNHKSTGIISLIEDPAGDYLGIITDDNNILQPFSMTEGIVLAVGQEVTVCYNIDSTLIIPSKSSLPVNIGAISYRTQ